MMRGASIRWGDGRRTVLDNPALRYVDLAYAHTSFKEQGATHDREIVALSAQGAQIFNKESDYVSLTRAKDNTEIVTSDWTMVLQNAGAEVGKSTALEGGGVARAVAGVQRRLNLSTDELWSRGAELNGEQTKVSRLEPMSAHATQRLATQPAELLLAALREPATSANRFDGGGSFLGDLSSASAPNIGPSYLGKLDELEGDWAGRGGMLGKLDWDGLGQEHAAGAASATSLPTMHPPSPLSLNPADLLSQQQQGLELDTGNAVRAGTDTTLLKGREPPTVVTHQRVPDQGKVPDLGRDHGQDRDQGLLPG